MFPIKLTSSVLLDGPRSEVWQRLTSEEFIRTIQPLFVSTEHVEGSPPLIGSKHIVTLTNGWSTIQITSELQEFEKEKKRVFVIGAPSFTTTITEVLEDVNINQTRYIQTHETHMLGLKKYVSFFFAFGLRQSNYEILQRTVHHFSNSKNNRLERYNGTWGPLPIVTMVILACTLAIMAAVIFKT